MWNANCRALGSCPNLGLPAGQLSKIFALQQPSLLQVSSVTFKGSELCSSSCA
jgi:hypothetical protein